MRVMQIEAHWKFHLAGNSTIDDLYGEAAGNATGLVSLGCTGICLMLMKTSMY